MHMDKDKKNIISSNFRTKLEDYELPVRKDLWEKIEQNLTPEHKAAIRLLWKYIGGIAASIALILSLGWGVLEILNNQPDMGIVQIEPPKQDPIRISKQPIVHEIVETKEGSYPTASMKGAPKPLSLTSNSIEVFEYTNDQSAGDRTKPDTREEQKDTEEEAPIQEKKELLPSLDLRATAELSEKTSFIPRKKKNDLSLALAYINQGAFPSSEATPLLRYSEAFSEVSILNENELEQNVTISDTKHKTPVTASLIIRKLLNNKWALESGLTYTYLETSEIQTQTNGQSFSNTYEMHYLGIPVKMVYSVVSYGDLEIYASAGGMVEKNVYAQKLNSTDNTKGKLDIPELQWSVEGNVGMSYKVFKQLNLFVEPGVGYYFDDKSEIFNIRKDKPLNFNLQVGLRVNI